MTTLHPDHVEAATVRGWLDRPDAVAVVREAEPVLADGRQRYRGAKRWWSGSTTGLVA